jgi:hypothetical protein
MRFTSLPNDRASHSRSSDDGDPFCVRAIVFYITYCRSAGIVLNWCRLHTIKAVMVATLGG